MEHKVSALGKTWLFDLDGTLVVHNGYKAVGRDTLLDGAKEFIDSLPKKDTVIILTSRTEEYRDMTMDFLAENNIRYDHIIFGLPFGERIIINDRKPKGLETALAVNTTRDIFMPDVFAEDESK